jgi:hypothetical protein
MLLLNFIIAIGVQVARLHKMFPMYSVVRKFWLESRPKLRAALETHLPSSQFPTWSSVVMVGGQVLPIPSSNSGDRAANASPRCSG